MRQPAREVRCPVERVDNPAVGAVADKPTLLAQDAVFGESSQDRLADSFFRSDVDLRHDVVRAAFAADVERAFGSIADDLDGLCRGLERGIQVIRGQVIRGQVVRFGHGVLKIVSSR